MRRLALILVPLLALPWSSSQAAPTPVTTVGSPSVPGTIRGFQLVGHTDLGNRGMPSL